jgi:hypothetical protein
VLHLENVGVTPEPEHHPDDEVMEHLVATRFVTAVAQSVIAIAHCENFLGSKRFFLYVTCYLPRVDRAIRV